MPSIVSKVKNALHSDHNSAEDGRTGKLDMSDADYAQYGTGTHGASEQYGIGSYGGSQDQGRYMGAGQMNPTSPTSGTRVSSDAPGAFPRSEHEMTTSHHRDGREYVPPRGTQVGEVSSGQSGYDRAEQAVTGRDTTGNYGQTSSNRGTVDDRILMDPASRDSHSNVMGGPAGGVADTGAGTGFYESGSGHNKLQKKDDPRGYTGADEPSSHYPSKHHGHHGTHHETVGSDPYERQAAQAYDGDTSGKHHGHHGAEVAAATAGTAGAGGLVGSQIPERRHHGETGREAYTGSNDQYYQGNTGGAGSHLASSTQNQGYVDDSRGSGVYNTVTGAGSGRDYDREDASGLGRSTGKTYDSGSGAMGAGTTALGAGAAGAGAAGLASHHHNKEREQDYGRGTNSGYGTSAQRDPISTGYGPSTTQPGTTSTYGTSGQSTGLLGGAASGAGATSHYYGPGHEGAKVMHKCSRCGEDDDISHYFKKDVVYRLQK